MNSDFGFGYLIAAIAISSIIGIYAWRHRQSRGCRAFAVLILVSILWMFGSILFGSSQTLSMRWLGRAIQYLGIPSVPVALLVFVYRYCGKSISRRSILRLGIVPVVSWVVMADPLNYLFGTVGNDLKPTTFNLRGYYFWWIHIPYSYILLLTSLSTVFIEISRTAKRYRGQIVMLFVAMCVPFTADILGLTGVLGSINLSPLSFLVFFVMVAICIVRYQFLGGNPIAYEIVFQTIRDGVIILDRHDIIRDVNGAAAERVGKNTRELIGRSLEESFSGWSDLTRRFREKQRTPEPVNMIVADADRYISIDVTPVKDIDESVEGWVLTLRDVTEQRRERLQLRNLAFRDPLTQLANRRKFDEEVERAIEKFTNTGKNFAILFLDLNRFKAVNDTLGHEVGDELLKYVAGRLTATLRRPDMAARVGGDEFAALLHETDEDGVQIIAERILKKLERPFKLGEHTLKANASIGAAIYPINGGNLTELMRYADAAMYSAKSEGRGQKLYSIKQL